MKDNTLMLGEWHGGQHHILLPTDQEGVTEDVHDRDHGSDRIDTYDGHLSGACGNMIAGQRTAERVRRISGLIRRST